MSAFKPTLLDKLLLNIAPDKALRRIRTRAVARNLFEAGELSAGSSFRRHSDREAPDQNVGRAAEKIRSSARHLEENYDVAEAVLQNIVNNVAGISVLPEPQVRDLSGVLHEDINSELAEHWREWSRRPDVTGQFDYHAGVRQHVRSWVRDGDVFQQYVEGITPGLVHDSYIPLSLEHIEADFLPVSFNDPKRRITQSIEKNAWGRPVRYWVFKEHPGNALFAEYRNMGQPDKTIPAANMIHQKLVRHFRQTRGVSVFANVLARFEDIKDTEESERVAARCAAAMVGFRRRGTFEDWYDDPNRDDEELSMDPGTINDLGPGEEVSIHASNRPNNALIEFMNEQMRRVAGGTGTGFSSISRNYNGTFSAQRQELAEGHVSYGVLHAELRSTKLDPDWRRLVQALIKYKIVDIPADVDVNTLFNVDIPRPPMVWVDPKKEADASVTLVDNNLESREHVMRMRGRNPADVRRQIDQEQSLNPEPEKTEKTAVLTNQITHFPRSQSDV